jgi:hypothetical protein
MYKSLQTTKIEPLVGDKMVLRCHYKFQGGGTRVHICLVFSILNWASPMNTPHHEACINTCQYMQLVLSTSCLGAMLLSVFHGIYIYIITRVRNWHLMATWRDVMSKQCRVSPLSHAVLILTTHVPRKAPRCAFNQLFMFHVSCFALLESLDGVQTFLERRVDGV